MIYLRTSTFKINSCIRLKKLSYRQWQELKNWFDIFAVQRVSRHFGIRTFSFNIQSLQRGFDNKVLELLQTVRSEWTWNVKAESVVWMNCWRKFSMRRNDSRTNFAWDNLHLNINTIIILTAHKKLSQRKKCRYFKTLKSVDIRFPKFFLWQKVIGMWRKVH